MGKYNFHDFDDLKNFMKQKNFKKIFLISGKNSFTKSGANKMILPFLKSKNVQMYFKKSNYPEYNELKNIILFINQFNPDLILAVGGGSVIDYAKIARLELNIKSLKQKITNPKKSDNFKKKFKLATIPTTAGSGAEVTENAVIYIKNKKYSVEGKAVKPDYFFLIPKFIINSTRIIKSSAGFDAISQAIESLLSNKSTQQSVMYAKESLKISLINFQKFVNKPNYDNTMKMSIAANLSGKAISISKTTAPHALSYPFTSHFGIPHGHAVSLTLNDFLKFNFKNLKYSISNFDLKKRYQIIFNLAKVNNIKDLDFLLNQIKINTGLENNFKKLGVSIKSDYRKIISGVNIQRLKNNPINLNRSDIKNILLNK